MDEEELMTRVIIAAGGCCVSTVQPLKTLPSKGLMEFRLVIVTELNGPSRTDDSSQYTPRDHLT
jgi:hypothetical protein